MICLDHNSFFIEVWMLKRQHHCLHTGDLSLFNWSINLPHFLLNRISYNIMYRQERLTLGKYYLWRKILNYYEHFGQVFFSMALINTNLAVVQIMTWIDLVRCHYLNQWWTSLRVYVTRCRRVNPLLFLRVGRKVMRSIGIIAVLHR